MENLKIVGENIESYKSDAVKAACQFIKDYKAIGAKKVTVSRVVITDRNNLLNFEVIGKVNGNETAINY
jgi:hypothetical protein